MPSPDAVTAVEPAHDLFVIHAEADAWFVQGVVLPAMGLAPERVRLVSTLPLGQLAIVELERGLAQSRLALVVLSHAFVADVWSKHAEALASHAAIEQAGKVIPLLLDDCPVPLRLAATVSLDLRSRERWENELSRLRVFLQQPVAASQPIACPYPGMRPFRREEALRFFGRERDIDNIVQHLRAGERELYAVGPSGSGKSSLLMAGVLPRIERGEAQLPPMLIRTMRPGDAPVARLAELLSEGDEESEGSEGSDGGEGRGAGEGEAAWAPGAAVTRLLARGGGERLLLLVDQLEELFAVTAADERARFIARLLELRAEPRCILLFGLRADFFGALIDSALWRDGRTLHVTVAPLRGEALRQAILRPAHDAGVFFEPGLVERLLGDADSEPGILPLLQEALVQLWGKRARRVLTLAAYVEMGQDGRHGLAVAISRHADACLRALPRDAELWARRILLRLVTFGEGAPDTRRQQPRSALAAGAEPAAFSAALEALAASRLITLDGSRARGVGDVRVDLAHEALLVAWRTLATWLSMRRKEETQRRLLDAKVAEWRARRHEDSSAGLLDVVELREAEGWLAGESARELGEIEGLTELVMQSRAERDKRDQHFKEARRLLGAMYLDWGRQLLLDEHPQRAIAYLVAARQAAGSTPPLQMLFHRATRVTVAAAMPHIARVNAVAFCPAGLRVVTAGHDGTARVWDALTGAPLSPPLCHEQDVKSARFSPDGARVVTASGDGTARVWDAATGALLTPPLRHASSVWSAEFSADGTRIVTASLDRHARVWDARSGEPITPLLAHRDWVLSAAFSPDGSRVVTASDDSTARVWDATTGAPLGAPLSHEGSVLCAAFSPDGSRVVTSGGKAAWIWDAQSGAALAVLRHGAPVNVVVFSPDGGSVATGSADRTARLWDAARGKPLSPPLEHGAAVEHVSFDHSGAYLLTGSADRTARLWDVASGKPAAAALEHGQPVLSAAFSPDGARLVTASGDHVARVWDVAPTLARLPRLAHGRPVLGASFSPDGTRVITVARGKQARLWDARTGAAISPRLHHDRPVRSAVFSPDGRRIATASWDQSARIWDAATGALLLPRLVHRGGVECAAFSADGKRLVTAATDRTARIWDVATGALLHELPSHGGPVRSAAFSLDGTLVITACDDGAARLWQASSGMRLYAPILHGGAVLSAGFSPDGELVVTSCADGSARVWRRATGEAVTPPMTHAGAVYTARFSCEGARVLTASADKTARIWDAQTGRQLLPAMEHTDRVMSAAFSHDGTRVVTASLDHTAQIWDVALDLRTPEEWQEIGRRSLELLAPEPSPLGPRLEAALGAKEEELLQVPPELLAAM